MEKSYRRMSYQQRIGIYYFLKQGLSMRSMAKELEVCPSTISREIKRNKSGKIYFPSTAQRKTRQRWQRQSRKLDKYPSLKRTVFSGIRKLWSPEQISADLSKGSRDAMM